MTMTSKPTRIETAFQLRDHALAIVRRHGSYQSAGDAKFLMWRGEALSIMHRTPFQKWQAGDAAVRALAAKHEASLDDAKYAAATHGLELPEVLPYGLDVWHGKKVLSLEWADDGRARVISFKRGDWEEELSELYRTCEISNPNLRSL
jgi:hypothetical protein